MSNTQRALSLAGFIREYCITMTAERTAHNPHMDGSADMDHWRVTLRMPGHRMTLTFSMGRGHYGKPPDVAAVLECLQADATYPDMSFAEWCRELGYDEDSRKAERTYKATVRQTERLRAFIGDEHWTAFLDARPE